MTHAAVQLYPTALQLNCCVFFKILMRIINFIYSIVRKSFEKTQDGGNTYLSSLVLLSWFSFGSFYNIIYSFLIDSFDYLLMASFISSELTAILLFFYPGYKYEQDKISKGSNFYIQIITVGIFIISITAYFASVYILYNHLM